MFVCNMMTECYGGKFVSVITAVANLFGNSFSPFNKMSRGSEHRILPNST